MKGAKEYYDLFKTGQYGKLWIQCGSHARGKTFNIYIIPDNCVVNENQCFSLRDAVEVYGVVSGHPGWTESYGWLHAGIWQHDFDVLVSERKEVKRNKEIASAKKKLEEDKKEREHIQKLLDNY